MLHVCVFFSPFHVFDVVSLIVNYCMEMFTVQNPHYTITKRKCKFRSNIMSSKNILCEICRQFAEKELELCAYPSNWSVNVA